MENIYTRNINASNTSNDNIVKSLKIYLQLS